MDGRLPGAASKDDLKPRKEVSNEKSRMVAGFSGFEKMI
jgi:hypothetical protein